MSAAAIDLLQRKISNPDTQWSLGTFGAIAEFSRDPDEPVRLVQSAEAVSAVTPRGGIALKPHAAIRPFASEGITRTGWNQRVALCLPRDDCAMHQRVALTEIGPDHEAPREEERHERAGRGGERAYEYDLRELGEVAAGTVAVERDDDVGRRGEGDARLFDRDYEEEDEESFGDNQRKERWRYRWTDEFRDEVLARLLELNHTRAEEEAQSLPAAPAANTTGKSGRKSTKRVPIVVPNLFDVQEPTE